MANGKKSKKIDRLPISEEDKEVLAQEDSWQNRVEILLKAILEELQKGRP
jgi:hypothetical protein